MSAFLQNLPVKELGGRSLRPLPHLSIVWGPIKTTALLYFCCWLTTRVDYRHMSDEDNSYTEFMQHIFIFSITTEAEGRREGTQYGVPPCLAGREGWGPLEGWWFVLYCDGQAVPPVMSYHTEPPALATQLRVQVRTHFIKTRTVGAM